MAKAVQALQTKQVRKVRDMPATAQRGKSIILVD